jgi:hypothetical protein
MSMVLQRTADGFASQTCPVRRHRWVLRLLKAKVRLKGLGQDPGNAEKKQLYEKGRRENADREANPSSNLQGNRKSVRQVLHHTNHPFLDRMSGVAKVLLLRTHSCPKPSKVLQPAHGNRYLGIRFSPAACTLPARRACSSESLVRGLSEFFPRGAGVGPIVAPMPEFHTKSAVFPQARSSSALDHPKIITSRRFRRRRLALLFHALDRNQVVFRVLLADLPSCLVFW